MSGFEPIAIVGRGCVLPGALTPGALGRAVSLGLDLLSRAPPGRWGLQPGDVLAEQPGQPDRTRHDRGGYVRGFEQVWRPEGFRLGAPALAGLDPLFLWSLHAGREALAEAGLAPGDARCGVVLGNLSFPSRGMSQYAESVWRERLPGLGQGPASDPRHRFHSGLPAHLLAEALGLGAGAFALDAACASALYAIKQACDQLHDGRADRMLAGAVNAADDLFLHQGFSALSALSPSGQSRPFHRGADGLVPAEGAVLFALERLDDAQRAGRRILGVIRGVGLSNDGRGRTLLTPSAEGQVRALRRAYAEAGLEPRDISLLECHATGTQVGDAVELTSLAEVFAGAGELPLGSLKSNLGHLITAAGGAALLKVLWALEHQTRPPTLHVEEPTAALEGKPFRLLTQAEAWPARGPRRAGVSAFGFGGNNAHLIVEEWTGAPLAPARAHAEARPRIAVVGLGARVAGGRSAADFARALQEPGAPTPAGSVAVALDGLRTPPHDLEETLPQQLLMLEAAREALRGRELSRERTGVLVGMGCDPGVARYGARWRLPSWARAASGQEPEPAWLEATQRALQPALTSAGVLGTMPNLIANRISAQLDLAGPGYTVSSEERSGLVALELAVRALQSGELDAALVGAVDLSCEPVHARALAALGITRTPGDGAVALLLQREADARASGAPILALLGASDASADQQIGEEVEARVGAAHAALGLVRVAAAVVACAKRERTRLAVQVQALGGQSARVVVEAAEGAPVPLASTPPTAREQVMPAHRPEPRAEPLRTQSGDMPLAPALPPLLDLPAPAEPEPVREAPRAASPARLPAAWAATVLPEMAAQYRRLGEAHRAFVEQQAALHQRFLDMRQRSLAPLLATRGARPSAMSVMPVLPVPPAPTPAPAPAQASKKNELSTRREPVGPRFDRAQLEALASKRISSVLGPQFARQDEFRRQVRMPEPPLLLADRVLGIDAEPGSMGTGTLWTETDIAPDAWYLHHGRMPAGILIESGQADLLLISWLGADFENRGQRVYRLLGCELTYHGNLPGPGETLRYQIQIDGHARQGDTRLFFFHYDCVGRDGQPRLTVRQGQAGFFTDEELAGSAGILWDPATAKPRADAPLDPPSVACTRRSFSAEQVRAFARGDLAGCFGPGFELGATHVRTPGLPEGKMLLLDRVETFDPRGGPWGRGYLKATLPLAPDTWFFDGHFKDDPCMPGTLMFEGCLQAMAFYLAGLGYTLRRDGWRFEPVPDEPYALRCRGQATPRSRELVYELFVEEVQDGPTPTLRADLLCTVDGLKAFHARRVGVRLTPDWPLEAWRHLPASDGEQATGAPTPLAPLAGLSGYVERAEPPVSSGFTLDRTSLLACAWGRPSGAFGKMYAPFDTHRRVPRLPGPPYHFMTRITRVEGEMGSPKAGSALEVEYDLPERAWYFEENGSAVMPFSVLMEAALQPCGWLASYGGFAVESERDLLFRNLDGQGTVLRELRLGEGALRTRTKLTQVSRTAGMAIVSFEVECDLLPRGGGAAEPVFRLSTVFGFFPEEAFANQVGLPPSEAERARCTGPEAAPVELGRTPTRLSRGTLRLPGPMLRMLERVDAFEPQGGRAGLGYLRAHAPVRPETWFFRAHFFQDPVQPGSLGVEAACQLLQFFLLQSGLAEGLEAPAFETVAVGRKVEWKYRGQVVPANHRVTVEVEITQVDRDASGVTAVADAWLWVDDKRIYQMRGLAVRAAPGRATPGEEQLSLESSPWLGDHRPTFTVPALPFMSIADRLASAARAQHAGLQVVGLSEVSVARWVALNPGPVRLRTEVGALQDGVAEVVLLAWREAATAALSRFEPVARGRVHLAEAFAQAPAAPTLPEGPRQAREVYATGRLFHGPAFRLARQVGVGADFALSKLDATPGAVPVGVLAPALLDAALHGIPHDRLSEWCPGLEDEWVAYPVRLARAAFFGATPRAGEVSCLVRLLSLDRATMRARFQLQLWQGERLWAELELEEALLPKGPLGRAEPALRRAFLGERRAVEGVGLSHAEGQATVLSEEDVRGSDWLPGTLAQAYALRGPPERQAQEIALKEHVARQARVHPAQVDVEADGAVRVPCLPLSRYAGSVERSGKELRATGPAGQGVDLPRLRRFWDAYFPLGPTLLSDLFFGLVRRFISRVELADPASAAGLRGRPVLFLANHQVGVESPLFRVVASALVDHPVLTLAKAEHRRSWLGRLSSAGVTAPGSRDPGGITFFDRGDPASLPRVARELGDALASGQSVLVHVEGTRSRRCGLPVEKLGSIWIDLALERGVPVVPVRFAGALPREELAHRLEFPLGHGQQEFHLGRLLEPDELRPLPLAERKRRVLETLNRLGPTLAEERPLPGDPAFGERVQTLMGRGYPLERAVLLAVLEESGEPCAQSAQVLQALRAGAPRLPPGAEPWLDELASWLLGVEAPG